VESLWQKQFYHISPQSVCHIHATCLHHLTDLDAIWQLPYTCSIQW